MKDEEIRERNGEVLFTREWDGEEIMKNKWINDDGEVFNEDEMHG